MTSNPRNSSLDKQNAGKKKSSKGTKRNRPTVPACFHYTAHETLTPVELNYNESVHFTLKNGQTRILTLLSTEAEILENVPQQEGLVYSFSIHLNIDGHPIRLRRYAPTQESFYEPAVVNGLRIWPDMVLKVFNLIPMRYPHDGNLRQRPYKEARLALQDATLPICPGSLHAWYENTEGFIPVSKCYHGGDVWMGPFGWGACHGGLDICHPRGGKLFAPFDLDNQAYFNSLKMGHENNRWRGLRRWSDGALWAIQTHHLIDLLTPEHTPLAMGTPYATSAGTATGDFDHTHFEFKIVAPEKAEHFTLADFDQGKLVEDASGTQGVCSGQPTVFHLDPWILFREIFLQEQIRQGQIPLEMTPLSPARTDGRVHFSVAHHEENDTSNATAPDAPQPRYVWSFNDGTSAEGPSVTHAFLKPGIYLVTLTRELNGQLTQTHQHITVDGEPFPNTVLAFASHAPEFYHLSPGLLPVFGERVPFIPQEVTLQYDPADPDRSELHFVDIRNNGNGGIKSVTVDSIDYCNHPQVPTNNKAWLLAEIAHHRQITSLALSPLKNSLPPGTYHAKVILNAPEACPPKTSLRVTLKVGPIPLARHPFTLQIGQPEVYCTPGFWVGHQLAGCHVRYVTNGNRSENSQFVRFTPQLASGLWRISIPLRTPTIPCVTYQMAIFNTKEIHHIEVNPFKNRIVGDFYFKSGTCFIDIHAKESFGLITVSQLEFTPLKLDSLRVIGHR